MVSSIERESAGCPFMNSDDPRCASHFTLKRLNDAFADCLGAYGQCPNFHRLRREHGEQVFSINTSRHAPARELRATGS